MSFTPYQWANDDGPQEIHHVYNPYEPAQSEPWRFPQQQLSRQENERCKHQRHLQLNHYESYYRQHSLPINHYYYADQQKAYRTRCSEVCPGGQSSNGNISEIPYRLYSNLQVFRENNCSENDPQWPSQYQRHNPRQGIITTKYLLYIISVCHIIYYLKLVENILQERWIAHGMIRHFRWMDWTLELAQKVFLAET